MGLPACVIASGRQRAWLDETVGMEDSQKHAAVETNPLQVIATWSDCYIFEFLRILISFFLEEVCVWKHGYASSMHYTYRRDRLVVLADAAMICTHRDRKTH